MQPASPAFRAAECHSAFRSAVRVNEVPVINNGLANSSRRPRLTAKMVPRFVRTDYGDVYQPTLSEGGDVSHHVVRLCMISILACRWEKCRRGSKTSRLSFGSCTTMARRVAEPPCYAQCRFGMCRRIGR